MHGNAGCLADSHETLYDFVRIIAIKRNRLPGVKSRDSTHVVMHRWQHRDGFTRYVDSSENFGGFRNTGQSFVNHITPQMLKMQVDMVLFIANATTFSNLHRHGAADDIA